MSDQRAEPTAATEPTTTATAPATAEVARLAGELWELQMDLLPVAATLLGLPGRDDRLPDYSPAGQARLRARAAGILARVAELDPAPLPAEDRVTWAVLREQAAGIRDELVVPAVEYTVADTLGGPVADLFRLLPLVGVAGPGQAEGYLARLAGLPALLEVLGQRNRDGIAAGRLPVRRLAQAAVDQLDRYVTDPSPLRRPEPPAGAEPAGADGFRAERDRLLAEVVQPALAGYRDRLAAEVVPHGRPDERPGLSWLPDGEAYYATLARLHTTTDRTPEQLHRTGRDVIAALAGEYAQIGERVFGTRELAEIFTRLREDPALRWRDGDELLDAARAAVARAEQAAPDWFGRLPSQRCQGEPVADRMGLYSGDLARLGMLCLDSMRAGRLVVDTGLHAHGWSRQQAVDYLREHTPMSTVEVSTEVDRYIAAPGQALAYLVGRLEIERLREYAQRALASRFDVRGFHDTVLGAGPLPLSVLAEVVDRWVRMIAERRGHGGEPVAPACGDPDAPAGRCRI